jgi:hypothetical protein
MLDLPDSQRLGANPDSAFGTAHFDLLDHRKERTREGLTPRGNGAVIATDSGSLNETRLKVFIWLTKMDNAQSVERRFCGMKPSAWKTARFTT